MFYSIATYPRYGTIFLDLLQDGISLYDGTVGDDHCVIEIVGIGASFIFASWVAVQDLLDDV